MEFLNNLLYYFFLAYKFILTKSPKNLKRLFITVFYRFAYTFDFFRKKTVKVNMDLAFSDKSDEEKKRIMKQFYKNFVTYVGEMIENMDVSKEMLEKKVHFKNDHFFDQAKKSGKPIVMFTAHFGNWEILPKAMGAFYTPMVALMRPIDNKKLNEFIIKSREAYNVKTINKTKSSREIIKALKQKTPIAILIDQSSKADTAETVKMCGHDTCFNRAVSTLAAKFGAIVIPVFTYKNETGHAIEFLEPKEIGEMSVHQFTQWQASVIEDMIKAHPDEYYWFHKRWKRTYPELYK